MDAECKCTVKSGRKVYNQVDLCGYFPLYQHMDNLYVHLSNSVFWSLHRTNNEKDNMCTVVIKVRGIGLYSTCWSGKSGVHTTFSPF
jgi:hypothetical protein